MDTNATKALDTFKNGGIVIFPTDTALGIGCRIDNVRAVDRLFAIRKRPVTHATPVLVSSRDMAITYYDSPSDIVRHLMNTYWPGALTIVAPCKKALVYSPIRGDGETVGLRMPNHMELFGIIDALGVPVIGTSANFSGGNTPYTQSDLDPELVKQVDFVLPGEGSGNRASTVIDCSGNHPVILRQGVVIVEGI